MALAKSSAWAAEGPIAPAVEGRAATIFSAGNGTPMMPVEEGKTSSKMQLFSSGYAGLDAGFDASFSGHAVGVTGVDEDRGDATAGGSEVLSANDDGSGNDAVSGEHGRGVGPTGGKGDGEIKFTADFDASFDCSPLEAEGKICGGGRCFGTHRNYFIKRISTGEKGTGYSV